MTRRKQETREQLNNQKCEYEFQIQDQTQQIEDLEEKVGELSEVKSDQSKKLMKTTFELKTIKKLYESLLEVYERQTIKLLEKDKLAEDMVLKATGAEESLAEMRQNIAEMVEMEVAGNETKFQEISAELEHFKEKQK